MDCGIFRTRISGDSDAAVVYGGIIVTVGIGPLPSRTSSGARIRVLMAVFLIVTGTSVVAPLLSRDAQALGARSKWECCTADFMLSAWVLDPLSRGGLAVMESSPFSCSASPCIPY